jgi:hypothetical protein
MRSVFGVLFCALHLLAAPLAAAQDSQARSFTLQGQAQASCGFSAPQSMQASNMALASNSASQNVISITSLVTPNTAQLLPGSISLTLKGLCNQSHSLSITTANGGLKPQGGITSPLSAGFASRVDYIAQVTWAATSASLSTSGLSGQSTPAAVTAGAYSGNLFLQITINASGAGNQPLIAGTYTDILTVTLSPQL